MGEKKPESNGTSVNWKPPRRRRWREEDARAGLAAARASGKRLSKFAREHGFHVSRLFWDRNGYCMASKRLERGTFRVLWDAQGTNERTHVEVEAAELALILEGIDLRGAKRRARWTATGTSAPTMTTAA